MTRDDTSGIWQVAGDPSWHDGNHYYLYEIELYVPAYIGGSSGGIKTTQVTDPYALGLSANSERSFIVDLNDPATKPDGWDSVSLPAIEHPVDIAIYELHVRDFSVFDASTPATHRGKYLAFTHTDTAPMQHLLRLRDAGLTHVHLLPTYDIGSIPDIDPAAPDYSELQAAVAEDPASLVPQDEISAIAHDDAYNWGYDPWHYTVPQGSYATDPNGVARIREYRQMVKALAEQGLRVTKDIVYNHTFASGWHEQSVLDRVVPGYYYRLTDDGAVHTSTCCPNTATEHRMMEKLMLDSMETWAEQYRIGAFRFDLMGHHMKSHVLAAQERVQAIDPDLYIYGEGWNFGEVENNARGINATQFNMAGTGIGTFNDRLRDAARGGTPFDEDEALIDNKGVINDLYHDNSLNGEVDRVRVGIAANLAAYSFLRYSGEVLPGSHDGVGYAARPDDVITYVSKHDNQTLFDNNVYKLPIDTPMEERVRVQNLGISVTALSQGIPFFHGGVDMLRSKSLDRDSYNSGDWFNRLDFTYGQSGSEAFTNANNWAVGLPPAEKNAENWEVMEPLLRAVTAPETRHIERSHAHLQEMLQVRQSSELFRLRTAEDVKSRLSFHNTGPEQQPGLIAFTLSDNVPGLPQVDANWGSAIVLFNFSPEHREITLAAYEGDETVALHPVQVASDDPELGNAQFNAANATFAVPPRTTAVFVSHSEVNPAN
ncbi:hypothetical protein CAI21_19430 [Alkalilimnicola ehrlichii]|uniref:Alpha-1,6-glucosidases pullulanase-type C-terminal domain-containing protein n=2 Tax=Alkalilimnicola ehrlichii TaxID=351052 RepID=A0A3E0WHM1_9GAMM|nr:hypothetical protein CAI21_19430 [Alkalilimnicola ehrlichii]RFA32404.1 hypothetical protein CAL65_19630 [Alkalilimnicola ehrlichii]